MIKTKSLVSTLLILMLGSILTVAGAQEPVEVKQQDGISYVGGGVSDEEQQAIKGMADQFNLHLTFAVEEGNYLSDVQVSILDQEGNTVLDTTSTGPLFYADLEPGTYTVRVNGFDQSFQETVQLEEGGQVAKVFHWETPTEELEEPKL